MVSISLHLIDVSVSDIGVFDIKTDLETEITYNVNHINAIRCRYNFNIIVNNLSYRSNITKAQGDIYTNVNNFLFKKATVTKPRKNERLIMNEC